MKFYPLTLQDAVLGVSELAKAKPYKVSVPTKPDPDPRGDNPFIDVELQYCSVWQLLNVDVDQACRYHQSN